MGNPDKIRVLLVDDHILYRWGVMGALSQEKSLEVVDEASDGVEAVVKARSLKPDVVLMDLHMPGCDGLEATRKLQEELPDTKILINTVSDTHADLLRALREGAKGYILKSERPEALIQAIKNVMHGGMTVSPSVSSDLWNGSEAGETGLYPMERVGNGTESGQEAVNPKAAQDTATSGFMSHADPDSLVTDADLVISPPLVPTSILRLHKWLQEAGNAMLGRFFTSQSGESVLNVVLRRPLPLLEMLAAQPYVATVTEESYVGGGILGAAEDISRRPSFGEGANASIPKRFRLLLTAV